MLEMKRVLLTGATGFVGRQCLQALIARGYEVHAVTRKLSARLPASGAESWHEADLLEGAQVSQLLDRIRPSHLMHCAWYAEPGEYWQSAENFRWVEASLHLTREFSSRGGARAVYIGSCAEYEWAGGWCHEQTTPLRPTTIYGACKDSLRKSIDELAGVSNSGPAWGRLFFLYGPYEHPKRLVASAIRSVLRGEPPLCRNHDYVRDYLCVTDAGDALAALLDSKVVGPVNIASGAAVSLGSIVQEITGLLKRPDLFHTSDPASTQIEPKALLADVTRLSKEVGWKPRHDLRSGLAETINWWSLQLQQK